MFRKLICLLITILGTVAASYGQKPVPTDSIGYFILNEGDTVVCFNYPHYAVGGRGNDIMFEVDIITYYEKGSRSLKKKAQDAIRELRYGKRLYINRPIASMGMKRLQEVIIFNDKYMLTRYYGGTKTVVYLYDLVAEELIISKRQVDSKEEKDLQLFKEVKKYFTTCDEGLAAMEKGIKAHWKDKEKKWKEREGISLFEYITNYDCGSKP